MAERAVAGKGRHPQRPAASLIVAFCLALLLTGCASTPKGGTSREPGSPAGSWVTIQRGDTLGRIANSADVPLIRLQRFNPGVDSRALAVGQRILVPHGSERAPSGGPYRYRIRPGDTFSRIARHFGTSPSAIVAANRGVDPAGLAIGQLVSVPLKSAGTGSRAAAASRRPAKSAALPSPGPLPAGGQWDWPLADYSVSRGFGKDSRGTLQPMLLHTRKGAQALAVADGEVRFADSMRQLGEVVIVHHPDNLQSVYAHCKRLLVKSGARVSRGNPVCDVGVNDRDQHELLFDMRHGGRPINPSRVLP